MSHYPFVTIPFNDIRIFHRLIQNGCEDVGSGQIDLLQKQNASIGKSLQKRRFHEREFSFHNLIFSFEFIFLGILIEGYLIDRHTCGCGNGIGKCCFSGTRIAIKEHIYVVGTDHQRIRDPALQVRHHVFTDTQVDFFHNLVKGIRRCEIIQERHGTDTVFLLILPLIIHMMLHITEAFHVVLLFLDCFFRLFFLCDTPEQPAWFCVFRHRKLI